MWVALFLVCSDAFPCEHVVETEPTYHVTKEKCEEHAAGLTVYMTHRFRELGYAVEIGYRCNLDESVKRANG